MKSITIGLLLILFGGIVKAKGSSIMRSNDSTTVNQFIKQKIKFVKVETFGSIDEVIVGKIASFVVGDNNQVFIADRDQTTVHVFNSNGSYQTSLGRKGNGPGEFAAISPRTAMKVYSNRLIVTDVTEGFEFFPHRLQTFSVKDLSFVRTIKLLPTNKNKYEELEKYSPKQFYPLNNEKFLVAYRRLPHEYQDEESYIRYVIQDSNGRITSDLILEQKDVKNLVYTYPSGYTVLYAFPFYEKSLLAVSADRQLYVAQSGAFKIDVLNMDGEHLRSFQYPFENKPLNIDWLIEYYEETEYMSRLGDGIAVKMIKQNKEIIPDHWPALESMFFDDKDRLWVSTIIEDRNVYEWWILEKSGELITKFKWPRDKPIEEVRNGYIYTREKDEMDVETIVKYEIKMNGA